MFQSSSPTPTAENGIPSSPAGSSSQTTPVADNPVPGQLPPNIYTEPNHPTIQDNPKAIANPTYDDGSNRIEPTYLDLETHDYIQVIDEPEKENTYAAIS